MHLILITHKQKISGDHLCNIKKSYFIYCYLHHLLAVMVIKSPLMLGFLPCVTFYMPIKYSRPQEPTVYKLFRCCSKSIMNVFLLRGRGSSEFSEYVRKPGLIKYWFYHVKKTYTTYSMHATAYAAGEMLNLYQSTWAKDSSFWHCWM